MSVSPKFWEQESNFFLIVPSLTINIEEILILLVETFKGLIFLEIVVENFDGEPNCILGAKFLVRIIFFS